MARSFILVWPQPTGAHRCILLFAIDRRLPAPGNPRLIGGSGMPVNGRFGGIFADRPGRHRWAAERRKQSLAGAIVGARAIDHGVGPVSQSLRRTNPAKAVGA